MMKKILSAIVLVFVISQGAFAQGTYDPHHTMLALNMAIVSVNRILTTQDRIVLEWEYENIINRLAIGNIESDSELKELYDELLGFINGKRLRNEDMRRLKDSYKRREQEAYYRSMSKGFENLKAQEENPSRKTLWGWIGNLFVSGVSSVGTGYYDYQASKEQIHREISEGSWQLKKEELEACNRLQTTLLNSSWSLLSKYHLPNDYRLTQENVKEFLSVMEETEPSKRLGRLKFIERKFKVYPPYWFFRAKSAMEAGNESECRKSFMKFNEVWRPVLNYDPYKLEAAKYEIRDLAKKGVPSGENAERIRELIEVVRDYATPSDWGSNLFAGIVYFALGDVEEAITCVEYGNVNSGRETEISRVILAQMKRGKIDVASLPEELRGLFEKQETSQTREASSHQTPSIMGIQADSDFYARADLRILRRKKIGITVLSLNNAYWAGVMTALEEVLTAAGAEVTIVACKGSSAEQISQIENFIAAGCDLIMVHPSDANAVEDICAEARNFGIKVMCWDDPMTNTDANWLINNTNLGIAIGELAGDFISKHYSTSKKAEVTVIGYPQTKILLARENGIKIGLKNKADGKYEIVATQAAIEANLAQNAMETILQAHPDCRVVTGIGAGAMIGADEALKRYTGGNIPSDMGVFTADVTKWQLGQLADPAYPAKGIIGFEGSDEDTGKACAAMFALILEEKLKTQNVFRGLTPITTSNVYRIMQGMK